jgi:hypothetical protein
MHVNTRVRIVVSDLRRGAHDAFAKRISERGRDRL